MSDIIPLGTEIKDYGVIGAVGMIDGERYYWMHKGKWMVSMMPAAVIEPLHRGQQ